MKRDPLTPKAIKPVWALFLAVFSPTLYLQKALPHNLAAELRSPQFAEARKEGTFPGPAWPANARAEAESRLQHLRKSLFISGLLTLVLIAAGLVAALLFGKVHPSLPPDAGKVTSTIGASLAAWGTVFQFRGFTPTWRGVFIHEVAHDMAFKLLTIVGFTIAVLGGLWWQ